MCSKNDTKVSLPQLEAVNERTGLLIVPMQLPMYCK